MTENIQLPESNEPTYAPKEAIKRDALPESPLGRDVDYSQPAPQPEVEEGRIDEPETPQIDPKRFAELEEQANYYQQIINDPDLSEALISAMKAKNGGPVEAKAKKPESTGLESTVQQLHSDVRLLAFMIQNPDLQSNGDLRNEVFGLVREGLPLQKAYDLAKKTKGAHAVAQPKTPRLGQTETGQRGGTSSESPLSNYRKRIASSRNVGEAVDLAFRAAMEQHSSD